MSNVPSQLKDRSGGQILADQLQILGADMFFCVPGESFLELLDGLYEHQDSIKVITCRHESGASNMAEAHGKLTGKPGICAVTRGPGATNGSNGVHTAFQDSTPMIFLIGQVGTDMIERDAFQEIDYRRMFGQMAKWVAQIDDPARIPEFLSRAWHVAQSGRPGPVVLALPENTLSGRATVADAKVVEKPECAPLPRHMDDFSRRLAAAKKPMLALGGPGWSQTTALAAQDFAQKHNLPVTTSFRRQDYFDNTHPNFAGVIGIGPNPKLSNRIKNECDLLITVGARFGEMPSQSYTLLDIPTPQMDFIHIHPGPEELGRVYNPTLAIQSSAAAFFTAAAEIPASDLENQRARWVADQHADHLAYCQPTDVPGDLNLGEVIAHMSKTLPKDTVFTNGAGNYSVWLHRFHQHRMFGTQLAPTSGSMGYGTPAAIAARLSNPNRKSVCLAGDGCFLMTAQELATDKQYGAGVIYLVVNNGMYGTIRMHQERHHPARIIATELTNPDFVAYASAFGIPGEAVTKTEDFPAALHRACQSDAGYLIELQTDAEALTPTQTLSEARNSAKAH